MNLRLGGSEFINVAIPVLWGSRAVIQDGAGRISVIDLGSNGPLLEVLGDKPGIGTQFVPTLEGFKIIRGATDIYHYNPSEKTLTSISLNLPECQIGRDFIRVGAMRFTGNSAWNSGVGMLITEDRVGFGAAMPPELSRLLIRESPLGKVLVP